MAPSQPPMAQPIAASMLLDALHEAGVTDVVAVPDTHQRSLIELLQESADIRFIQTTTEDEAIALAAGLIIGGRRPIVQIQHAGLFACVNNMRGVAMDGEFPLVFLIGLLGRDVSKTPRDNFGSMVRLAEPLLETLDIPSHLLEGPDDVGQVVDAFSEAEERGGPVVLFVGTNTN
jgi:sulfopyruvate decarboxylase TPP-binding subunit